MKPAFSAELRKIFTLRSTYVISAFAFALLSLVSFLQGLHWTGPTTNKILSDTVTGGITGVAGIGAIVAVLLVTHEYRYNTIAYTLTAAKSRRNILIGKILSDTIYVLIFSFIACVASLVFIRLGLSAHHVSLPVQNFPVVNIFGRCLFTGWGFSMLILVIASLIRNQVASIVALFLIPGTVEPLLGLLLKKNVAYLPFSALNSVVINNETVSHVSGMVITLFYLAIGWIVAWVLLNRRDAN